MRKGKEISLIRMKGGVSILLLLILLAGAQAGEVWKGTEKLTDEQAVALFAAVIFYDVEFLWFAMPGCLCKKDTFEDATFRKCNLSHAHFEQAEFSRTWFLECDLKNASFNGEDQSDPRKKHSDRRSKKYSV